MSMYSGYYAYAQRNFCLNIGPLPKYNCPMGRLVLKNVAHMMCAGIASAHHLIPLGQAVSFLSIMAPGLCDPPWAANLEYPRASWITCALSCRHNTGRECGSQIGWQVYTEGEYT